MKLQVQLCVQFQVVEPAAEHQQQLLPDSSSTSALRLLLWLIALLLDPGPVPYN
jgi:hypothetical protein